MAEIKVTFWLSPCVLRNVFFIINEDEKYFGQVLKIRSSKDLGVWKAGAAVPMACAPDHRDHWPLRASVGIGAPSSALGEPFMVI